MGYTIEEVIQLVGLNIRKIQRLEKEEIIERPPKGKVGTKTRLLYSKKHIDVLWRVKFYTDLGYDNSEIEKLLKDKTYDKKELLGKQIEKLEEKISELQRSLKIAKDMYELGITPTTLSYCNNSTMISYDDFMDCICKNMSNHQNGAEDISDDVVEQFLSEDDKKKFNNSIQHLKTLFDLDYSNDSSLVQEQIEEVHNALSNVYSKSVLLFNWFFVVIFFPSTESSIEVDNIMGYGFSKFILEAFQLYVQKKINSHDNEELKRIIEEIGINCIDNHFPIDSYEVVNSVEKMYDYFAKCKILSESDIITCMHRFANLCFGEIGEKLINSHEASIALPIILSAINYYCENRNKLNQG